MDKAAALNDDPQLNDLLFGAPIQTHMSALATDRRAPALALAACLARMDEAAPPLRAVIARAANGEPLSDADSLLAFRGLHVLGAGRDRESWPLLRRLIRLPIDDLDALIGDGVTETLPRIVAGVFDGDAEPLFDLALDRSIDEYVRHAVLSAAAFLTWDGRIDRERMRRFLTDFHHNIGAADHDYAWIGWLDAISHLGMRELAPLVRQAWAEGRIEPKVLDPHHFEDDLADAERAPNDAKRMDKAGYGDRGARADARAGADPREPFKNPDREFDWDDYAPVSEPAINPFRNVGRNDPCVCGSGKKAKKCCLVA